MPEFEEKVTVNPAKCIAATDKAILVRVDEEEFWIPQTQIDDDSEVYRKGDEGKLVVRLWIAEQKGLV